MKQCIDCEFVKKVEEGKIQKLMCSKKGSFYYGKIFGLTAHACKEKE